MKTRFSFALVLLLMGGTVMGQGQSESSNEFLRLLGNGQWWTHISDDAKENYIDGYVTAMFQVNYTAHYLCMDKINNFKPKLGDPIDATMGGAMDLCGLADFFNYGANRKKIQGGVDEFYEDSQNIRLPVHTAIEYVRDKLKGDTSSNELQKKLDDWRKIANK